VNQEDKEEVYDALTNDTYDMEALARLFKLDAYNPEMSTVFQHLYQFFYNFLSGLFDEELTASRLVGTMKEISLDTCSNRWTSKAAPRVARCFGLPADGHVVHTLMQGRIRFLSSGPNADTKVEVVRDSDSEWDMASHRCGVWLLAHSSLGKDNALAVLNSVTKYVEKKHAVPQLAVRSMYTMQDSTSNG
jgi:hypothetical protein